MGVRMRVRHQSVGRAQGTRLLPVLPELFLTTVFPITRFSVSCRISRADARRLPFRARTSRRRFRCGCNTSGRPVDLFTRHQRPCDARHLVRQSDRYQPDRAALQNPSGPRPDHAIPLWGSVNHRRSTEDKQLADLPVARFGDPTKAGLPAGGKLSWHQAKPGREVPCGFEQADVDDGRCDQRRGDRANAGDRCQAACGIIVPRVSDNLHFDCPDTFSQCTALVE